MSFLYYQDGSKIIADVPILYQGKTNTCAQACITMVLIYWGFDVTYEDIIQYTTGGRDEGLTYDQIVWTFRKYGLHAEYMSGRFEILKSYIDKSWPTIVEWQEKSFDHVVTVVGYNDNTELIYYIDPHFGNLLHEPYSSFIKNWSSVKRMDSTGMAGGVGRTNLLFKVYR